MQGCENMEWTLTKQHVFSVDVKMSIQHAKLSVSGPNRYSQPWQAEGEGRLMVYDSSYIVEFPQVLWESGWEGGIEKRYGAPSSFGHYCSQDHRENPYGN